MSTTYKHLTLDDRNQIERMLKEGTSCLDISKSLGKDLSTIYREIRRGTECGEYTAKLAQTKYDEILKKKGKASVITPELAAYISKLILEDNLSVTEVLTRLAEESILNRPKTKQTLYYAIKNGLIPGVTEKSLRRTKTHIFSNSLIHLPSWVINELNLKDNDCVEIQVVGGRIILEIVPNGN